MYSGHCQSVAIVFSIHLRNFKVVTKTLLPNTPFSYFYQYFKNYSQINTIRMMYFGLFEFQQYIFFNVDFYFLIAILIVDNPDEKNLDN